MDYIECPGKRVKCERYGNCDECKKYHHNKNSSKSLTRCEKLKKKEQKKENRKIQRNQ